MESEKGYREPRKIYYAEAIAAGDRSRLDRQSNFEAEKIHHSTATVIHLALEAPAYQGFDPLIQANSHAVSQEGNIIFLEDSE